MPDNFQLVSDAFKEKNPFKNYSNIIYINFALSNLLNISISLLRSLGCSNKTLAANTEFANSAEKIFLMVKIY